MVRIMGCESVSGAGFRVDVWIRRSRSMPTDGEPQTFPHACGSLLIGSRKTSTAQPAKMEVGKLGAACVMKRV